MEALDADSEDEEVPGGHESDGGNSAHVLTLLPARFFPSFSSCGKRGEKREERDY